MVTWQKRNTFFRIIAVVFAIAFTNIHVDKQDHAKVLAEDDSCNTDESIFEIVLEFGMDICQAFPDNPIDNDTDLTPRKDYHDWFYADGDYLLTRVEEEKPPMASLYRPVGFRDYILEVRPPPPKYQYSC